MIAIIASKKDIAGVNIAECLKKYDLKSINAELHVIEEETIFSNNIDKEIDAELFIFATRHKSEMGVPCLSCHCPGNWSNDNSHGGEKRKLCRVNAVYLKEIFLLLNRINDLKEFKITMECSHHGPFLEKPCMFVEIGSSEEQWKNKKAGEVIARVIFEFLKKLKNNDFVEYKVAFAIGGPHYLSILNKFQLGKEIAIGHTCPKYMLENLDKEMILQAIEKTIPNVDFVLLDWKGLGKEKQRIISLLEELKIGFKRSDKL